MATRTIPFVGPGLCAGLNDTSFPTLRTQNQAKTLQNMKVNPDWSVEKVGGRLPLVSGWASRVKSLIVPPQVIPLVTVVAGVNDRLLFTWTPTSTGVTAECAATIAAGDYSTYDSLAAALKTALNNAVAGADPFITVDHNSTTSKKFSIHVHDGAVVIRWPKRKYALTPTFSGGAHADYFVPGGWPEKTGTYLITVVAATTFNWSFTGVATSGTTNMATTATYLNNGFTAQWSTTAGHTASDTWTIVIDETTVDFADKLGFRAGLSIAAAATGASEFEVDEEPPYRKVVGEATQWWWGTTTAADEIKTPLGFAPKASPYEAVGYWNRKRWYGSNGVETFVLRDKYLRKATPNNVVKLGQTPTKTAANYVCGYEYVTAFLAMMTLGPTTPRMRLNLPNPLTPAAICGVDETILKMSKEASNAGAFQIKVSYEVPSFGYCNHFYTLNADDLETSASSVVIPAWYVAGVGTPADHCILLEYVPLSNLMPVVTVYGTNNATDNVQTQNQDGVWATAASCNTQWWGQVKVNGVITPQKYAKVRFSLRNREGYESELGEAFPFELAQDWNAAAVGNIYVPGGLVTSVSTPDDDTGTATDVIVAAVGESMSSVASFNFTAGTVAPFGTPITFTLTDPQKTHILSPTGTEASPTLGFVADGTAGAKQITLLNATILAHTANPIPGRAFDVYDNGSYLFVAYGRAGIYILNRTTMVTTGKTKLGGLAVGITVSGNYAYVACDDAGLKIVNVASSTAPFLVATKSFGEYHCSDVKIMTIGASTYAFCTTGKQGLTIVNVTNPYIPKTVGTYNTSTKAVSVALDTIKQWAYVADEKDGILMLDCADPTNPVLLYTIPCGGVAQDVVLAKNSTSDAIWVIIAQNTAGVKVVPASDGTGNENSNSYYSLNIKKPDLDSDWEEVCVYRTKSQSSYDDAEYAPYFRWATIPRKAIAAVTTDTFTILLAGTDDGLEAQIEGNLDANRDASLHYRNVSWWDNRAFVSGVPDFPHAIFWTSGTYVEEFNPAVRWAAIGRDTMPVVGHTPAGDRFVIFKRSSFHEFFSIGNDEYGQRSINDDGIGSLGPRSIVSAITPQGYLAYFQGQDGHFYATDGQGLKYLSRGRLDVFVATLNMTALDKTYAFMNPATGEIGWSVCTGVNTTPNKTVIYNPALDTFSIETGAADIWALDYITTAGEINVIGSSNCGLTPANKIFHWRKAAYDIDAATGVEAIWESADYYLNNPNITKSFRSLIDRMSAAAIRSMDLYTAAGSPGLDDCTISGTPAVEGHRYVVKMFAVGTTDQIKISPDGGTTYGEAQNLVAGATITLASDDTVYATFAAKTGHSVNDTWAPNALTLAWYLDGSATAAGMTYLTFDVAATVYDKIFMFLGRARARTIRFKISGTAADVSGSWKVGMREIESEYVRTVVR